MEMFLTPDEVIAIDDSGTLTEAKAAILIEDTVSRAIGLVPELEGVLSDNQTRAVKAILRKAILRWHQTGSGAVVQRSESTGSYSASETVDTKSADRALFTQNEIKELRGLFNTDSANSRKGKAFYLEPF